MVSLIVPAYNEELLIGRTLQALNDAGSALGQPFEVVVADDASTDRTTAIAHEYGARPIRSRDEKAGCNLRRHTREAPNGR